jgi:ABC-type Zn uptake system ZnuABC Zn-binding protein ZnuA
VQSVPLKRILALVAIALLSACGGTSNGGAGTGGKIPVVTTISTFNSFVTGVGGDLVHVQSLVPVGASPETYQPTPEDVATLAHARLLVENGAGLEAWLARVIGNTGSKDLVIVVGTDGLPVKNDNPHLWMDPVYAKHYVLAIRDALVRIDPAHANDYRTNALRYLGKLDALTASIRSRIDQIPPNMRKMIVFHNAWQYYNDRFGIETLGFIERNPGQEPNPQQIGHLIDLARSNHLHAIFSEPEFSPKLAQQIAGSSNIHIVDNLYDDSIGAKPEVADYISMLNYDTNVIVKAMR